MAKEGRYRLHGEGSLTHRFLIVKEVQRKKVEFKMPYCVGFVAITDFCALRRPVF